jgi:hypothetical protein
LPENRRIKTARPLISVSRSGNWISIMIAPPPQFTRSLAPRSTGNEACKDASSLTNPEVQPPADLAADVELRGAPIASWPGLENARAGPATPTPRVDALLAGQVAQGGLQIGTHRDYHCNSSGVTASTALARARQRSIGRYPGVGRGEQPSSAAGPDSRDSSCAKPTWPARSAVAPGSAQLYQGSLGRRALHSVPSLRYSVSG